MIYLVLYKKCGHIPDRHKLKAIDNDLSDVDMGDTMLEMKEA